MDGDRGDPTGDDTRPGSSSPGDAEPLVPARERVRVRDRPRVPRWRRTRLRMVLTIAALILGLGVLDLAWASYSVERNLVAARDALQRGGDALVAGNIQEAADQFAVARSASEAAGGFERHPSIKVLSALPWFGNNIDAVGHIADAGELAAEGGDALTQAVRATGWDGSGIPGISSGGNVDLRALRAATPGLDGAVARLGDAQAQLRSIDASGLLSALRSRLVSAQATLDRQANLATTVDRFARLLPDILGGNGPQSYLLALTNLSAPRGTGGYFGIYGVLRASHGKVKLTTLAQTGDVAPLSKPVKAPPDAVQRYERFGMFRYLWAANYSPDFPTSARVEMAIAQAAGIGHMDGVISVDTVWVSYMLQAVGPVTSSAWPDPITADNVIPVLNRDSFKTSNDTKSNAVQDQIGLDIWNAVLTRQPSIQPFADAMSRAVRERHLQVYVRDPKVESALNDLGVSGTFTLGANPLAVVWEDYVGSRSGYFADKDVSQDVTLSSDGSATVSTTVSMKNNAPDGPPSILLGSTSYGEPVGYWAALASVYLPAGAANVSTTSSAPSVLLQEHEFDHAVSMGLLRANSGEGASFTTTYTRQGAVITAGGTNEYAIQFLPQASLRPIGLTVTIHLPTGAHVIAVAPGMTVNGSVVRFSGAPTEAQTFWVRYD